MADGGIYEFEPASSQTTAGAAGAGMAHLKGTAAYRERMALPPRAVFEAVLEDVSKADAQAEVLGRARIEKPGNPPIHFDITYDPSRIDPKHRYAVRAHIMVDQKTLFTGSQERPDLAGGAGNEVHLMLRHPGTSISGGGAGGRLLPLAPRLQLSL